MTKKKATADVTAEIKELAKKENSKDPVKTPEERISELEAANKELLDKLDIMSGRMEILEDYENRRTIAVRSTAKTTVKAMEGNIIKNTSEAVALSAVLFTKFTVATEVAWYMRGRPHEGVIAATMLRCFDFGVDWWKDRKSLSLEEWAVTLAKESAKFAETDEDFKAVSIKLLANSVKAGELRDINPDGCRK